MKKPDEIKVRYCEDEAGRKPFTRFFNRVKPIAALKITAAITWLIILLSGGAKKSRGVDIKKTRGRENNNAALKRI